MKRALGLVAGLFAFCGHESMASAAYEYSIWQTRSDVHVFGAGDIKGMRKLDASDSLGPPFIHPGKGIISLGALGQQYGYIGDIARGTNSFSFGNDVFSRPNETSGSQLALISTARQFLAPGSYDPLTGNVGVGSATFTGQTLISLGLKPGKYTYNFSLFDDDTGTYVDDTITVNINAPTAADYVVDIRQIGSSVYAFGAGSINTDGLTRSSVFLNVASMRPEYSNLLLGDEQARQLWSGASGISDFGSGGGTRATRGTGSAAGITGFGQTINTPLGYVSGTSLGFSSATFSNASFESLGVARGRYGLSWGAGSGPKMLMNIGALAVPEPATWGLMILGFGATGGAMRRRHSVKVAYPG